MQEEAELHAREDEDKKNFAESKNKLDASIFTAEKSIKDFADKVKPEDKEKIESKVKEAKDILAKTDAKKEDFDKITEELNQMLQVIGQAVYAQPQAGQPGAQAEEPKSEDKKSDDKKDAEEGEIVK
jgi:molecular chaperone DnaK